MLSPQRRARLRRERLAQYRRLIVRETIALSQGNGNRAQRDAAVIQAERLARLERIQREQRAA